MQLWKPFFVIYISCLEFNPRNNLIKLYQKVQSLKFIDFPISCCRVHFVFLLRDHSNMISRKLTHNWSLTLLCQVDMAVLPTPLKSRVTKVGTPLPLVGWCYKKVSSHHQMVEQAWLWEKFSSFPQYLKMMSKTLFSYGQHDVNHVNYLQ